MVGLVGLNSSLPRLPGAFDPAGSPLAAQQQAQAAGLFQPAQVSMPAAPDAAQVLQMLGGARPPSITQAPAPQGVASTSMTPPAQPAGVTVAGMGQASAQRPNWQNLLQMYASVLAGRLPPNPLLSLFGGGAGQPASTTQNLPIGWRPPGNGIGIVQAPPPGVGGVLGNP